VAEVYRHAAGQQQESILLLAENYGEAGALEFFGPRYGLPPVISPHNTYHLWSATQDAAHSYIAIGLPEGQLREIFEEVTEAGLHTCTYCMDYENNLPVYVCRRARVPYGDWWPGTKWYGGARKDVNPRP
jgi:hypothetical protein